MSTKTGNEYLILLSSNYRKEYIIDSLETIALTKGSSQHYRYMLSWIDPTIKELLNFENEPLNDSLKDKEVLIGMLFQKRIETRKYEWQNIVPIRKAKLKFAFKTGDSETSVGHFYFELGNIVAPNPDFYSKIKELFDSDFNKIYAKNLNILDIDYFREQFDGTLLFNELCENIEKNEFKKDDSKKYKKPLYVYLEGIKDKKNNIVSPKYNSITNKSYFELEEGGYYSCHYSTYSATDANYDVIFKSDKNCFTTPEEFKTCINAKYDKNAIDIVPSMLDRDIRTVIKLSTSIGNTELDKDKNVDGNKNNIISENFESLDLSIPISILIKSSKWPMVFELIGDSALVVLTIILIVLRASSSSSTQPPNQFVQFLNDHLLWIVLSVLFAIIVCKAIVKIYKKK